MSARDRNANGVLPEDEPIETADLVAFADRGSEAEGQSIFPRFAVNVPLPAGTAAPRDSEHPEPTFDTTRPLIHQLPLYRPGNRLFLVPTLYDHLVSLGHDMTDIVRQGPIPGVRRGPDGG